MPCVRVVVLARQGVRAPSGVDLVAAPSAYEAAAEILVAPARALVIDLGMIWDRHLGLLTIARDLKIDILAFGAAPSGISAEELSGVRLVSLAELPATLEGLSVTAAPAKLTAAKTRKVVPPQAPPLDLTLQVFDPQSGKVIATIDLGGKPETAATDSQAGRPTAVSAGRRTAGQTIGLRRPAHAGGTLGLAGGG